MNVPGEGARPDPDALLAQVREQARRAARGRLRIYFGAAAGVGKTWAMLSAARQLAAAGAEVLVGIVETHGRAGTASLLDGMEVLPRKRIGHRGRMLEEFDIDAALARHPRLVLVDELAHSNAPGSRHPKRWQDIDELLAAGIDVFTTVNVQHLDSLNDVVGGITGVRVGETVPDTVFDEADEVVLVDLSADELLARLKLGKVYPPAQAERAGRNFFRKGNLIALRELALRRTAERIGDDVRAYRAEKSIEPVWRTGSALLACVGPGPGAEGVVRGAARLAAQLGAEWHAAYVETPALQRLGAAHRARIMGALKLARDLGAATAVLSGDTMEAAVVEYARSHNLPRIVLGRAGGAGARGGAPGRIGAGWPWRRPRGRRIARLAPDIELVELAQAQDRAVQDRAAQEAGAAQSDAASGMPARHVLFKHGVAALASLGMGVATMQAIAWLDLANIAMLFLLVVLLAAVRLGRGPSVTATCVGVACFDFLFVSPRFTFAISDFQYLVTFGVMLAVGLITGHLTAGLRFQARVAARRESRTRALYEFARALSGVLQTEQIQEATRDAIRRTFGARTALLLPDAEGRVQPALDAGEAGGEGGADGIANVIAGLDTGIAQWAFDHGESAGMGTDTLPGNPVFYMPLVAPMRTRGVLAIEADRMHWLLAPEQRQQLDTFAALAAIALERVHYIEVAQAALVRIESERLRNSLLAALSHDLRTPLTSLMAQAESLAASSPPLAPAQHAMADALRAETVRMSKLVTNLLDMARIESGDVRLRRQWLPIEEAIGSALRASRAALAGHRVQTRVPFDLPLVQYDAVLIERVLSNLLENAGKYTPPGSTVTVAAAVHGAWMRVTVSDDGPGLPPGQEEALFEKFTRGERESAKPGVGLGLAICRAIVGAHGGTIHAARATDGGAGAAGAPGAAFVFTLPLGTPPALDLPDDAPPDDAPPDEKMDIDELDGKRNA